MKKILLKDLHLILSYINVSVIDYETWIKVLTGVKSEFGDNAKSIIESWSSDYENHKANEFNAHWKSLKTNSVNISTVIYIAKQNGFNITQLSNYIRNRNKSMNTNNEDMYEAIKAKWAREDAERFPKQKQLNHNLKDGKNADKDESNNHTGMDIFDYSNQDEISKIQNTEQSFNDKNNDKNITNIEEIKHSSNYDSSNYVEEQDIQEYEEEEVVEVAEATAIEAKTTGKKTKGKKKAVVNCKDIIIKAINDNNPKKESRVELENANIRMDKIIKLKNTFSAITTNNNYVSVKKLNINLLNNKSIIKCTASNYDLTTINDVVSNSPSLVQDELLIIPYYNLDTSKITGLQQISYNSAYKSKNYKKFLKGSKVSNSINPIGFSIENLDKLKDADIYLTEGFATGISTYEALNKAYPDKNIYVAVCGSLGNLKKIASTLLKLDDLKLKVNVMTEVCSQYDLINFIDGVVEDYTRSKKLFKYSQIEKALSNRFNLFIPNFKDIESEYDSLISWRMNNNYTDPNDTKSPSDFNDYMQIYGIDRSVIKLKEKNAFNHYKEVLLSSGQMYERQEKLLLAWIENKEKEHRAQNASNIDKSNNKKWSLSWYAEEFTRYFVNVFKAKRISLLPSDERDFGEIDCSEFIGIWNENLKFYSLFSENKLENYLRKFQINSRTCVKEITSLLYSKFYTKSLIKSDRNMIAFINGIYFLDENIFVEMDDDDMSEYCITHNIGCNYISNDKIDNDGDLENAKCKVENYLKSTFGEYDIEDKQQRILELVGHCMHGRINTIVQSINIFMGGAGSGKSTFCNIIENLVGKKNTGTIAIKHLCKDEFGLSSLIGKSLALVPETSMYNFSEAINTLKTITGGDNILLNVKNENHIKTKLNTVFIMTTNSLFSMPQIENALRDRINIIPFSKNFRYTTDEMHNIEHDFKHNPTLRSVFASMAADAISMVISNMQIKSDCETLCNMNSLNKLKLVNNKEAKSLKAYREKAIRNKHLNKIKTKNNIKSNYIKSHFTNVIPWIQFQNWCLEQNNYMRAFLYNLNQKTNTPIKPNYISTLTSLEKRELHASFKLFLKDEYVYSRNQHYGYNYFFEELSTYLTAHKDDLQDVISHVKSSNYWYKIAYFGKKHTDMELNNKNIKVHYHKEPSKTLNWKDWPDGFDENGNYILDDDFKDVSDKDYTPLQNNSHDPYDPWSENWISPQL